MIYVRQLMSAHFALFDIQEVDTRSEFSRLEAEVPRAEPTASFRPCTATKSPLASIRRFSVPLPFLRFSVPLPFLASPRDWLRLSMVVQYRD